MTLEAGSIVAERYRVIRRLGRGGMAIVYFVENLLTKRLLAMKVMEDLGGDPTTIKRFKREFAACSRIDHPHVVELVELGQLEDGRWFYTMDYLPHPSLRQLIDDEAPLPEARVIALLSRIAGGLDECHRAGIHHRDLKPDNIIVAPGDLPVIVDFGLARDATQTALTQTGSLLGTPYYMCPEMITGQRPDAGSDLWALGLICFEMLTGRRAFDSEDLNTLLTMIVERAHPAVSSLRQDCLLDWDSFVDSLLEKHQDERIQSAQAVLDRLAVLEARLEQLEQPGSGGVAAALARARGGDGGGGPPLAPANTPAIGLTPVDGVTASSLRSSTGMPPSSRHRPFFLLVLGVLFIVIAMRGLFHAPTSQHSVRDVEMTSYPGGLIVSWQSMEPYPSRLVVTEPTHMVIESPDRTERTQHQVAIDGFPDGTQCTFAVLYPSGQRSLAVQGRVGSLEVHIGSVERGDDDQYMLTVRIAPALEQVLLLADGEPKKMVAIDEQKTAAHGKGQEKPPIGRGYYQGLISPLPSTLSQLSLQVTLPQGGERSVNLASLLADEVGDIAARLSTFNPDALTKKHEGTFAERFARTSHEPVYERACQISPLVLGTRLLPFAEQVLFNERIRRVYDYWIGASFRRLGFPLVQPDLGHFAMTLQPYGRPAEEFVLYFDGGRSLLIGDINDIDGSVTYRRWRQEFDLPDLSSFTRSELLFEVHGLNRIAILTEVNSALAVRSFGLPILDFEYKDGTNVYQRIPIAAWQEGRNVLRLTADNVFAGTSTRRVDIYRLVVRFYR